MVPKQTSSPATNILSNFHALTIIQGSIAAGYWLCHVWKWSEDELKHSTEMIGVWKLVLVNVCHVQHVGFASKHLRLGRIPIDVLPCRLYPMMVLLSLHTYKRVPRGSNKEEILSG